MTGDVTAASPELGQEWVERVVGFCVNFCVDFVREYDRNTRKG